MEREFWEQALARAVTDFRFRARLLADPGDALLEYGLEGATSSLTLPGAATLGQVAGLLLHLATRHWDDDAPDVVSNVTQLSDYQSVRGSGSARRRSCARTQGVCKDARLLPHLVVLPNGASSVGEVAPALGDG